MGKFFDRFKRVGKKIDNKMNQSYTPRQKPRRINNHLRQKTPESIDDNMYDGIEDNFEDGYDENYEQGYDDPYRDDVAIQPAQKPESFHHYILENHYKDLEKSIRGYKDVFNKEKQEWETKRKDLHCFTDEEAEEILRVAQSLLAVDIKLSYINKEVFGNKAMMLFKQLRGLFREIAEYRYGRYSHDKDGNYKEDGYAIEQMMKLQNKKIFMELTERIIANYSRAIQGVENKATHQSVKGQESLQMSGQDNEMNRRYT